MNAYDLLEAMGGIRDEYVEEAAGEIRDGSTGEWKEVEAAAAIAGKRKAAGKRRALRGMQRWATAAAALLCLSVLVPNVSSGAARSFGGLPLLGPYFRAVTFRSYWDVDEAALADEAVLAQEEDGQIVAMSAGAVQEEDALPSRTRAPEKSESEESLMDWGAWESGAASAGEAAPAMGGAPMEESAPAEDGDMAAPAMGGAPMEEGAPAEDGDIAAPAMGAAPVEESASVEELEEASDEGTADTSVQEALAGADVTDSVRSFAEERIESFERSVGEETGYQTLRFDCGTVTDTQDWLCVLVRAFTPAEEGFEQLTHFVLGKKTGRVMALSDLFREGEDYVTPISENIKAQMRQQMTDPDIVYWLDSEEEAESDFSRIGEEQDYYINEEGNLVICFEEQEVAPLYMGAVEFVIPREATEGLLK